jgi:hypothetical protein
MPLTPKRSIFVVVGLLFILAAFFPFRESRVLVRARDWHTVEAPLSLHGGTVQDINLGTDLSGRYEINIEFEEVPHFEKLGCLVGNVSGSSANCDGMHSVNVLDVTWRLNRDRTVVREGSSSDDPSVWFSHPTIIRRIGQFVAVKGQDYRLTLSVNRDAAELNVAHPKTTVRVPMDVLEGYYVGAGLEQISAAVLFCIGGLIVIGAVYLRIPQKKDLRAS